MPFLVDSVLAAIRAKGGIVRLMAHPILPLDRDPTACSRRRAARARLESMLHIHIDPLPDGRCARRDAARDRRGPAATWRRRSAAGSAMLERLRAVIAELEARQLRGVQQAAMTEAVQFLHWLADHNFTFLGMREYARRRGAGVLSLAPVAGSGLGILSNPDFHFLRSGTD